MNPTLRDLPDLAWQYPGTYLKAINFNEKVRDRLAAEPAKYDLYLQHLEEYRRQEISPVELHHRIRQILQPHNDLWDEMQEFFRGRRSESHGPRVNGLNESSASDQGTRDPSPRVAIASTSPSPKKLDLSDRSRKNTKVTSESSHVIQHSANTNAEGFYQCNLCGKKFAELDLVRQHFWGETGSGNGCWKKSGKPVSAKWDDHPTCKFLAGILADAAAFKRGAKPFVIGQNPISSDDPRA